MNVPTQPVKHDRPSLHQGIIALISQRARFVPDANGNYAWVPSDPLLGWLAPALYMLKQGKYIKLPHDLEKCCKGQYQNNQHRWLLWRDRLACTLDELRHAGVPVLPLKGAAFIDQIYNDEGLRPFNNVNLLVPDQYFLEAADSLVCNGYHWDESDGAWNLETMARLDHSARPMQVRFCEPTTGLVIELHRHLLPSKQFLDGFNVNIRQIWARRVSIQQRGSLWTHFLSPYDTLAYLCLYQAMRGLSNLVTYVDIDALVRLRSGSWDWGEFVSTAEHWQIRSAAYHALLFSQALLSTPLPPDLLKSIDPGLLARQRVSLMISPRALLAQTNSLAQRYPLLIKLAMLDRLGTIARLSFSVLKNEREQVPTPLARQPASTR